MLGNFAGTSSEGGGSWEGEVWYFFKARDFRKQDLNNKMEQNWGMGVRVVESGEFGLELGDRERETERHRATKKIVRNEQDFQEQTYHYHFPILHPYLHSYLRPVTLPLSKPTKSKPTLGISTKPRSTLRSSYPDDFQTFFSFIVASLVDVEDIIRLKLKETMLERLMWSHRPRFNAKEKSMSIKIDW